MMENKLEVQEIIQFVNNWLSQHPDLKSPDEFIFNITGGINPLMANELFKDKTIEQNVISLIEFQLSECGPEFPTKQEFEDMLENEYNDWMDGGLEEDITLRGFA